MAELVILCFLICVAEYGISLGCFLEFLFSNLVARILVRVIFYCKFSVRLLTNEKNKNYYGYKTSKIVVNTEGNI